MRGEKRERRGEERREEKRREGGRSRNFEWGKRSILYLITSEPNCKCY